MTDNSSELQVIASEDGVMLFGSEAELSLLDDRSDLPTRTLDEKAMRKLGALMEMGGAIQERSGRWIKLTEESADYLKNAGVQANKLKAGVVRAKDIPNIAKGGQIAKHLNFEAAGFLSPAAPMVIASMIQLQSLENQLEDIQEYLEKIDKKLDQLLKQKKVESLGQIGGIQAAIQEAFLIYQETGKLSDVTWSKVQSNSTQLQVILSKSVEHLRANAELAAKVSGDPDNAAKELNKIKSDVEFWLQVLATALQMQDRQYVLELYRVEETDLDALEAHRRGITVARKHRTAQIATALNAIITEIQRAAEASNFKRVANPINAPRAVKRANDVNRDVVVFTEAANIPISAVRSLEAMKLREAVRGAVVDAGTSVRDGGAAVKDKVSSTAEQLKAERNKRKLEKAKKVIQELEGNGEDKAEDIAEGQEGAGEQQPTAPEASKKRRFLRSRKGKEEQAKQQEPTEQ